MRRLYTMTRKTASKHRTAKIPATTKINAQKINAFKQTIRSYYKKHGRSFPWRESTNPYHILVSEIMLQQTQADRVVRFYNRFIETLPTVYALATAPKNLLLTLWKGLGYNRRALQLQKTAQIIISKHRGVVPHSLTALTSLPGVGNATAGDIRSFAFNKSAVVVETNIRTAVIYFFFNNTSAKDSLVSESEIESIIKQSLPTRGIRNWYFGLMDYGAMLKKKHGNLSSRASIYTKQKSFKGSQRELRAALLFKIHEASIHETALLKFASKINKDRKQEVPAILDKLAQEGFIKKIKKTWYIRNEQSI